MFENVCMHCGKVLADDSVVYCSKDCESRDKASTRPRSRSSSVFASPYLTPGAAATCISDIPPLVLPKKRTTSSSTSTASDVTSVYEYESENETVEAVSAEDPKAENIYDLPPLDSAQHHESTPVSVSVKLPSRRTPISALPLNFNRTPAPSDTRSLAPALHMYAKSHSHTTAHRKVPVVSAEDPASAPGPLLASPPTLPKHKRASLPAYFSHLTLTSHASLSPPTLAHINVHVDIAADTLATPTARTAARHVGHQRGKSEQLPETWRDESGTSRVPVPGRERDGERERGRSRGRPLEEAMHVRGENDRRGRSRVITPRLKMLDS